MSLYPLLLQPVFKERIWGTRDLSPIYPDVPGAQPVGEAWLTGEECVVTNGPLAGRTLGDLTQQYGRELVGEAAPQAERFPLLVKLLFPREKLSVQVHPDDEGARRLGQPCGKTECWYVLKSDPGAQVGLGLKPGVTRADFERAIREVRAEQLMNWIDVHEGDLIYVDAGTVHAIGPGSILVETQQNSDTTYRLYDYGRPRELHVREGLAALKESTHAGKTKPSGDAGSQVLVQSPCFWVYREKVQPGALFTSGNNPEMKSWASVEVLVALRGSGRLEAQGMAPLSFGPGQAVVVPACIADWFVRPQWEVEFLTMVLPPPGAGEEPETVQAARAGTRKHRG